jgi:HTH-type transcriptional regulator/antitoxin HigA
MLSCLLYDIKKDFSSADQIGNNRIVFDMKGNDYRMICLVFIQGQKVFIRFLGTHAEYDKLKDAKSMNMIKPVRTKKDYHAAIKRIDELIAKNPKEGTPAYDELDVLGTLVSAYEDIHFPIEAPGPVEAVKYVMEENGLKQKDLIPYFGSKGLVSEFLSGKRTLSIATIKALHQAFRLPYDLLIS